MAHPVFFKSKHLKNIATLSHLLKRTRHVLLTGIIKNETSGGSNSAVAASDLLPLAVEIWTPI